MSESPFVSIARGLRNGVGPLFLAPALVASIAAFAASTAESNNHSGSTRNVSNAAGLNLALRSAQAGDIILLSPGTYSGLALNNLKFSTTVIVKSADPAHPAILTSFTLNNSSGLTFSDLEFSTIGSPDPYNAYRIANSENIHFTKLNVHGSLNADPRDDVAAFLIQNCTNISIQNSEFQQLIDGIGFLDSTKLVFTGNYLHDLGADGIHGGGSSSVEISLNYFTDFRPAPEVHPDAIQLWTSNTRTSAHDILIKGNVFARGHGGPSQGIFVTDQVGNLPYQGVTISDNLLIGTMYNAITLQGGRNAKISGNRVYSFADMPARIWVQMTNGTVMTDNLAAAFIYGTGNNVTFDPTDTNSNISTARNTLSAAVSDAGKSALQAWIASHPDALPPHLSR